MVAASALAPILHPSAVWGSPEGKTIRHLLLDSRILAAPADGCFFAIRGPRHDGHGHIEEMYAKGVRVFVVERMPSVELLESYILQVPDVIAALQALAAAHRQAFHYPVVGITGSNGKTTVKEWMAQLAGPLVPLVKSPRSYNSQVGVPLSVWQMQAYHKLALIEAGISTTGEMDRLAAIIRPTLGVFTSLGAAHDAGFSGREQKFEEKWKLFAGTKTVVYHNDGGRLTEFIAGKRAEGKRLVGWQITHYPSAVPDGYQVGFDVEGCAYSATLPFADAASVENALHAATALLVLGLDEKAILNGLRTLRPLAMRLEWKEGLYGSRLLDDTYNNDLDGLQNAVQQLGLYGQGGAQKRVLIVSDLPQTGTAAELLYDRAADLIRTGSFEQVWAVGQAWPEYRHLLPEGTSFYPDTDALMHTLDPAQLAGRLVLIKGGRAFGFERLVQRLQKFSHGTRLEVDLNAVVSNLNYYRSRLPQGHKIMAMVKAGAYGAGGFEIASALAYQKVDYLAVAYTDEGVALRNHGIALPILVMNAVEDQFDTCRQYHLEPTLYSIGMLRAWLHAVEEPGGNDLVAVHLELNTGMNRLGFDDADLPELTRLLSTRPAGLKIASVFSHLAAADDPAQDAFSHAQLTRYQRMTRNIADAWKQPFLRHIANTPGAARLPEAALDMVRLGIGLYGVEVAGENGLIPVGRLKSVVSQIRTVPAGESVSYGHRWVFEEPRRIATVAIGYADGLSRRMGNGNFAMRIRGGLAPTVGNVCMDMTMVDVTHLPHVQELDEVTIFDESNRLEDLARIEGTIPYEILTRISERVRRVYVSE